MITKHTYTLTYERDGQRIRDELIQRRLFGILPLSTVRRELWRKAASITDQQRTAVLVADSYQCVYCGSTDRAQLSIDHLTPQTQGGRTTLENLRTACRSCNSIKNGRTPEEANMPLVWGRYLQPVQIVLPDRTGTVTPEAAQAVALFLAGSNMSDVVKELRGVTSSGGARYQKALNEVQALIRTGLQSQA